ncbi:MAG: immunoglobulin-like domain-containing protein, partial [Patescibacteria group bacterium]
DNVDGDLTSSITTVNPVNTSIPGTYTITYNVTDNATNPATQVTRTVNVLAIGSGLPSYATKTPEQLVEGDSSSFLTINDNISFTAPSPQITLKFNNHDNSLITHLAISTSTDFTSSSLIDYTPSYSYNLCGTSAANCPDGTYKIYARYYTSYGQSSLAGPLTVELKKETLTPSVAPTSVTASTNTTSNTVSNNLSLRLSGRILLQVESHGEAWYINPDNNLRYYLGRPSDAFNLMRNLGLGAKTKDLTSFLSSFAPKRLSGKILLQVEDKGQAYYVNPVDLKLYYLGRPSDAFNLMRSKGLGITNENLEKMGAGN